MNVWLAIWAILDFASVNHEPPNNEVPEVVCEYFEDDCVKALGIAWCESLHNPRAYNGEDHGLFQINKYYWHDVFESKWDKRFEVEQSTRFAFHIVENTKEKWRLWTCGRYR
jgi:hypothetical protein